MRTDQQVATKEVGAIDKKRAEVAMVNAVGAQLGYQYRLNNRENELLMATQQIVELGNSSDGLAAYVISMELDKVWQNMPIFFDHYNFTVTDLNESKNIYYVNYAPVDTSFWDAIWGDDVGSIDLAEGAYQFALEEQANKTALVIYDDQGLALDQALLTDLLEVMGPALSFK
jgi:outer membrane protein assembly factor BamC